jgi:hypothetical protein
MREMMGAGHSRPVCVVDADAVQDAGHLLLDNDALHGDHAAVRDQPAVRGAGVPRLGLGRSSLLHLVRRHRHGRDLLLLPGTRTPVPSFVLCSPLLRLLKFLIIVNYCTVCMVKFFMSTMAVALFFLTYLLRLVEFFCCCKQQSCFPFIATIRQAGLLI